MAVRYRALGVFVMLAALFCVEAGVPAARAATLKVASDVSGAPFEYYPSKGSPAVGFDVDLIGAIGKHMNATIDFKNHQFDDLLAAVKRGDFDLAMSAISDTSAREKIVDFVDYFVAGGGIMVVQGNPAHIFNLGGLCGYSVTVESGTSYEADLRRQSKACTDVGLGAVRILTFPTDDESFDAFASGKSTAYVADYPVGVYRARSSKSGHPLEVVGKPFDVVPYGIAVSKTNATLRDALQRALLATVADGTYDALLKKWGLQEGAMRVAPVNAGKLFEIKQ